jgi:hypothetical protein
VRAGSSFSLFFFKEVDMTQKTYILNQLRCYGFKRYDDIPDEMFDYLPENLDLSNEEREEHYLEELEFNY